MSEENTKWYFDLSTGQVTQGPESGWSDRMGPYDTREEAENALKTAAERNAAADAEDEAWDN
ncbi:SPOR domain-containing protein [uncultured Corynebacterium sp.]|uniref:SPOR domain-containing protein n=1 Tax=uncultured Corynebacterium sp. TaxID=159447 RepID=UPI0025F58031|nr:SPOR domain-containing protein [uncultured Corynebacterium sp.]